MTFQIVSLIFHSCSIPVRIYKVVCQRGFQYFVDNGNPHFIFCSEMIIECTFCYLRGSNNVIDARILIPLSINQFESLL